MNIPCHLAISIPYRRPRAWGRRREARRCSSAGSRGARSAQGGGRPPWRRGRCLPAPGGRRKNRSRGQNGANRKGARGALGQEAPASAEHLQFN